MTSSPTIDELLAADTRIGQVPKIPAVDTSDPNRTSMEQTEHRTKLATHRTALSTTRTEMSSRRTGMSFQRSRMSAERTLMSVIRTSMSLISFGFTIYQFLGHLAQAGLVTGMPHAARNFGVALVWLGVAMMVAGIFYHLQFMMGLRRARRRMCADGLVHGDSHFPVSFTLLVAVLLLALGVVALTSLTFHIAPFD
jgi:uncharacterized membrane protein YidH (DUF202 family)